VAVPGSNQTVPVQATVQLAEAEVRSGYGNDPKHYVTNRLPRGTTVEVTQVLDDGWLAIVPPRGSFSWVNVRFLQRINNTTWIVAPTDDRPVPVLVGSGFKDNKPTAIGDQLKKGTQVIGIGIPHSDAQEQWLPILPPPQERRYIRQEAVVRASATTPPVTASLTPPAGPAGRPLSTGSGTGGTGSDPGKTSMPPLPVGTATASGGNPPAVGSPAPAPDPLIQKAQDLERANNWAEAIQVWNQLGNQYYNSDHDKAMQFYNRAEWLRRGRPVAPTPIVYGAPNPTGPTTRLQPVPAGTPGAMSGSCPPAPCPPGSQSTNPYSVQSPNSPNGNVGVISAHTSGPGRLRRAARLIDGRRSYYLESSQLTVITYATEQQGVNLEPYVDRNVELLGRIVVRGDVRPQYMTVGRVIPLQ
jgi:hypothetical protein